MKPANHARTSAGNLHDCVPLVVLLAAAFLPSFAVLYEPCLHVVLHQPEIPHNTGSVGRTCVAVGAKLWLVRPLGFRVDDYYLRRAGLDYWELLEWEVVDDWDALCRRLAAAIDAGRMWLFTKKAARTYADVKYARGDVLVFGCETQGLPEALIAAHAERALRIPTREAVRSLNLSNAAAVAMYEAVRQGLGAGDWGLGNAGLGSAGLGNSGLGNSDD